MGAFPPGRGGGEDVTKGYKGKGVLIHLITETQGNPLFFKLTGANGDEREQAVRLLRECKKKLPHKLKKLEADRGYDSKNVRGFAEYICGMYTDIPKREWDEERKGEYRKPKQSKGNTRWTIERTFAWIYKKFRRLACRWERRTKYFEGFMYAAICYFWLQKIIG